MNKLATYLDPTGRLVLKRWARIARVAGEPDYPPFELPPATAPMYGTAARATPLVSNGFLGADLIQIPAGEGFEPHTHIGDHLLFVVKGEGTITYEGVIYVTRPGEVYMVEGSKAHAVGAIEDHALLSIGAPHRAVDAADRMALTEYAAVAAELGDLLCLACQRHVRVGDTSCPHVPHPRIRQRPVALAPTWDEWEQRRLADWFGVRQSDLPKAVDLIAFQNDAGAAVGQLAGRVVVAYGKVAGALLAGLMPDRDFKVEALPLYVEPARESPLPALLITIRWAANDNAHRAVLRLAHTLAAAGPLEGVWADRDALELGWAIDRALIAVDPS